MVKLCNKCREYKDLIYFNAQPACKGGFSTYCTHCKNVNNYKNEKAKGNKSYSAQKEYLDKYRKKYSKEIKARDAVGKALKAGKLIKKSCEVCGEENTQAHHHKGYSKENYLKVEWLCIKHHQLIHLHGK